MAFWTNLTAPQATVLSGLMTFAGALAAVFLGWFLFSGRVTTLQAAIGEAEKTIHKFQQNVESSLGAINERIEKQDVVIASVSEVINRTSGEVSEIGARDMQPASGTQDQQNSRDDINKNWSLVRDYIERLANNPEIDGRTRARYNRIDRRSYQDLVDALLVDGHLNAERAKDIQKAIVLWRRYRGGKLTVEASDAQWIQQLALSL